MTHKDLELFVLKCAAINSALAEFRPISKSQEAPTLPVTNSLYNQFGRQLQNQAAYMAEFYQIFYMLENDIRNLVDSTLSAKAGTPNWWDDLAPATAKEEYKQALARESESGFTSRSDNPLDYVTFGQLQEIIRHNWDVFGGILSNQKALGRIMYTLNNLRGPIAHCGLLAEDEVDRLRLSVRDWFRLLEGPK